LHPAALRESECGGLLEPEGEAFTKVLPPPQPRPNPGPARKRAVRADEGLCLTPSGLEAVRQ